MPWQLGCESTLYSYKFCDISYTHHNSNSTISVWDIFCCSGGISTSLSDCKSFPIESNGDILKNRSAMRTCVAYYTTWRALDSHGQINKSDRAIRWLHTLCKPHKNTTTEMNWFHLVLLNKDKDLCFGCSGAWSGAHHSWLELFYPQFYTVLHTSKSLNSTGVRRKWSTRSAYRNHQPHCSPL